MAFYIRFWSIGLGTVCAVIASAFLIERCIESRRLAGPGQPRGAMIAHDDTTTTVLVHDAIPKRTTNWMNRIVAVDGATGARLATKTFRMGECWSVARGRASCKIDSEYVLLDIRTLEHVAGKLDRDRRSPGDSQPRCHTSETAWIDDANWGFAGTERPVFTRLPAPAESLSARGTPMFGARMLELGSHDERGRIARIGDDVLVVHRTSGADDGGHLLSRMGLDGIARWSVPIGGECSVLDVGSDRVIMVLSSHSERAIVIDARTGGVMWRLRFPGA